MQAICDNNLRIIYISVVAPGKTNDTRAYMRLTRLQTWISTLKDGYFCSCDNDYTLSNTMLISYNGNQCDAEYHRESSFYLYQLRIRIEMCLVDFQQSRGFLFKSLIVRIKKNYLSFKLEPSSKII